MAKTAAHLKSLNTSYVTITDKRTRKSKCLTVYDMTPTQLVKLINDAIKNESDETTEINRDLKSAS